MLAAVLEEYLAAWRAGKPPSNEQLTAAHPDLASLLQGASARGDGFEGDALARALELIDQARTLATAAEPTRQ